MKTPVTKAIAILLSVACMTGFTACRAGIAGSRETNKPDRNQEETDAGSKDTEEEIPEDTTEASSAAKVDKAASSAFQEADLIKVGEHTYYPDYLFNSDRDEKFKDYILSVFEECDKDLHDDIFVYVIMEAETKDEFRFSAKMIMDGVILEEGEMMNWYEPETGYVWDYDFSRFRRCDFTKRNLIPVEEACTTVYEDAKANSQKLFKGSDISGTYLLKTDGQGNLYYEFTVNKYSTVTVDAKTGSIIKAYYWNGIYT